VPTLDNTADDTPAHEDWSLDLTALDSERGRPHGR
jgi:hypothetical protein